MSVKASASITLAASVDIEAVWRYYLLRSATLSTPTIDNKTVRPPTTSGVEWSDTEPSYTEGSTAYLYTVECTLYSDGSMSYSAISKSSSYEAAKAAYAKALAAKEAADNAAKTATDFISPQSASSADDGIKVFPKSEKDNPQNYAQINQQGMQIYKGGKRAASFGSEKISLGENSEQSVIEMCGGLTYLSSEVKLDEMGNKIGYILLAPTEFAQSKDYPFRCGIASGKRDATIYLGDGECSVGTSLTPGAASINYIQSDISGSSEFDLNEEYPEDGPYAYTRIGMCAGMGMSDGSEPGAGIVVDAYLNNGVVESSLEIYADKITINGEPLADFVVEQGTSGIWTYEKWNSGKVVAYMPEFYTYSNLTMKAAGNLYLSEERYATLPSGLFVDTNYIVSHEFQSAGGPVSIIRQSGSTKDKFLFKIYKCYNTSTGVAIKLRIKGRWK